MAFTLNELAARRPYLFHLTARMNLDRIRRLGVLHSASMLAEQANAPMVVAGRRASAVVVTIGRESVHIRDQAPLHAGNITFRDGWVFDRLLRELNNRVFFWPGTHKGPISYGQRHFERYRGAEDVVLLRVNTSDMPPQAQVCFYNSGSPRCTAGHGSPRGKTTFQPLARAAASPSKVVEVTWVQAVTLPDRIAVAHELNGPWREL